MSLLGNLGTAGQYIPQGGYLSQAPQTVYVRPQRSIGGLVADVVIEEMHDDEMEITEHPVEQGASVTDHAYLKPSGVTIRGGVSNSGGTGTGDKRSVEFYEKLRTLQGKREPFDVVTGKRLYKNMLIKSISTTTNRETENVFLFTAELRELNLVSVQTVSVPRSRHKSGNKTGGVEQRGQVQPELRKRSALSNLFG